MNMIIVGLHGLHKNKMGPRKAFPLWAALTIDIELACMR